MSIDLRPLEDLAAQWLQEASEAGSPPRFDERYKKIAEAMAAQLLSVLESMRVAQDPLLSPEEANQKYGVSKRQLRRLENRGAPYKPLYLESDVAACRPRKRDVEPASEPQPVEDPATVSLEARVDQMRSEIRDRKSRASRGKAA